MYSRLDEVKLQYDQSSLAHIIFDKDRTVIYNNEKSKEMSKKLFGAEIYRNANMMNFVTSGFVEEFNLAVEKTLNGQIHLIEKSVVNLAGLEYWFHYEFTPYFEGGHIVGTLIKAFETTEKEIFKLESESNYKIDNVTGVFSRNVMDTMIHDAMTNMDDFHLINLDIDGFNRIIRLKGFDFGDEVLKFTASIMAGMVTDPILFRSHGDSFFMLMKDDELNAMETYFMNRDYLDFRGVKFSVSIGISHYPKDALSAKSLLLNTEAAMHQSKKGHGNTIQHYQSRSRHQMDLEAYIDHSLITTPYEEFLSLDYQPIINTVSGDFIGFEALLRWKESPYGNISPVQFIAVAERNGSMNSVTEFVIRQVADTLDSNRHLFEDKFISVNISILDLMNATLSISLSEMLDKHPWISDFIQLEITETSIVDDLKLYNEGVNELRSLGYRIAIDDFGTGYSSIDKLVCSDFDLLKIDKSFVDQILDSDTDYQVLETIITLAVKLDLDIIAEGIEHPNQVEALNHLGVFNMQGYHYFKPMPLPQLLRLLGDYQYVL